LVGPAVLLLLLSNVAEVGSRLGTREASASQSKRFVGARGRFLPRWQSRWSASEVILKLALLVVGVKLEYLEHCLGILGIVLTGDGGRGE
jgi:hypothetical protein